MKHFHSFMVFLLLLSCNPGAKNMDSSLLPAVDSIYSNPAYTLNYLENNVSVELLSKTDKAYYYLLLTEAIDKNDRDITPCDFMLDYAIRHLSAERDPAWLSKAFFYKGRLSAQEDDLDLAMNYYSEGLDIAQKTSDTALISKIHTYMGDASLIQGLPSFAMEHYRESYRLDLLTGDKRDLAISLRNMGNAHVYLDSYDSALFCYDKTIELIVENDDLSDLFNQIQSNISLCYTLKGDLASASEWGNKVSSSSGGAMANKGHLFLQKQQYDSARLYLEKGIHSADFHSAASAYHDLAQLERELENYKSADQYFQCYAALCDSIRAKSKKTEILQITHDNKLEAQHVGLQARHARRMIAFIAAAVLLIILITFFFLFNIKRKKLAIVENKAILLEQEKAISELNYQIEKLRNQQSSGYENQTDLMASIENKEKELAEHQEEMFRHQLAEFKKSKEYRLIERLNQNGEIILFNPEEQEKLKNEIHRVFSFYTVWLGIRFSELTSDDIYLCLLSKVGVLNKKWHLLLPAADNNVIRQRKHRIKKKM